MQELSQELRQVAEKELILNVTEHLRETAKKWANYCIDNLDGDLLTKGLMVSKSIVDFLNEQEAPTTR